VPNAQNKTCDDIFKLHPHLEKLAEKDENADYGDQMRKDQLKNVFFQL